MARLESIGAWALTEPSNGSDASALLSTAKQVPSRLLLCVCYQVLSTSLWACRWTEAGC